MLHTYIKLSVFIPLSPISFTVTVAFNVAFSPPVGNTYSPPFGSITTVGATLSILFMFILSFFIFPATSFTYI